ncbi:sensor histidine kinase [Algoriphagus resistens]|uniref:sensor histidine kinase n=1 Tax=Algoriphagus resistens TaxID=1750590 RepID=UPI00071691D0|nr:histidine kinase [Algoriphagus resistens]
MQSTLTQFRLSTKKEIGYHFLFWFLLAYFSFLNFNGSGPSPFSFNKPDTLTLFWIGVFSVSFYFNYLLVLPWVFRQFGWKRVSLGLVSFYLFFVGFRFLMEEVLMPHFFNFSNYSEGTPISHYFYDNLYFFTYPLIPSTLFWLIVFSIRLQGNHAAISEEKRTMEVRFLQSQLNPHFLFNTLNNIYSMVYVNSEKALPAIEKLSNIMRFTTYDSQKELIPIQEEIDYFNSYVELEQYRHEHGFPVQLNLGIESENLRIPPLILSPFIENAIKHGVLDPHSPLKINLGCHSGNLLFEVANKISSKKKDQQGGIGLENLRRRLQLSYPNQHRLELRNEGGYFKATLEIQL